MQLLRLLWNGWKKFAHGLGIVNRYILLTAFYFLIVSLVNLFVRLFRVDLLDRRMRPAASYWHEHPTSRQKYYQNQF